MEWYYILLIVLGCVALWTALSALFYRQFFKRFYDILLSSIGIILTAIPMMITAIFVRIFLGKPVLFKQERIGKNQKKFNIIKFRTMTDEKDAEGNLLPDEVRLTKFGKILRKTSLDEFPQFFNVLRGDISLVGPRPMMEKYLPADENVRARRFAIRPGITGKAQINGRTNITYQQRFDYDMDYQEHISLFGDIKILFDTAMLVLRSLFKKGNKVRKEDMEMLKGTMEYERLMASEVAADDITISQDKIVAFDKSKQNVVDSEQDPIAN